MVIATLETRHFTFTALGETREEALHALRLGWAAHAEQTGARGKLDEDDVSFLDIEPGQVFRDQTLILSNGIPTTARPPRARKRTEKRLADRTLQPWEVSLTCNKCHRVAKLPSGTPRGKRCGLNGCNGSLL